MTQERFDDIFKCFDVEGNYLNMKKKTQINFSRIAFEEFFYAMLEGKHMDSDYVRKKTFDRHNQLSHEQYLKDKNEEQTAKC